ncbi:hypothetical protein BRARA_D00259 [Brassica rapa]|uniref:ENT domain-containing protein n=1 Tax=Brassica campestris TaxID=3711 RepID=A0A397ZQY1_BRACM|nr:hypothetical protein BRARA_D00259 [Brassica rapa]
MADHKDQRMVDPLEGTQDPTFIPLTSSNDKDMTDQSVEEDSKKQKLNEQQRRAFYAVLLAFRAETLSSGNKRTQIIEKLMSEWSIAQETLVSFEDNIQKNLVAHQERVDSEVKEPKKPLTISQPVKQNIDLGLFVTKLQAKKPTLCSSWGRVNPEALVGRRVCVRMPGEDEFEVLVIKEFNAKDGTHRLATVDPNVMWLNETLSWIDVRKVPDEDIRWKNGEKPDFQTPPGSGAGQ